MPGPTVDAATDADLSAILALYNHEIREGVALWNTQERTAEQMAAWMAERGRGGYAVRVARGPDGAFLGYGAIGPFRPHDGYALTLEHSLYVAPAARGRGVGRALLSALEDAAREGGFHVMIGAVEAGNAASLALHARAGFVESARLEEVGRKFGRWLTLVLVLKRLS